jgi:peptidoglycan hydrolase-like protein with peptidoglycan-binding domain
MKRKEVLETEQLNEVAPLVAALMGALVGAGINRNVAQRAAQDAVADPAVAGAAGGAAPAAGGAAPAAGGAAPAAGGAAPAAGGTLRRGSRGEQVAALQRRLGINPDGIFGPETEAAVRAFQERSGIQADGVVGGQTQAAFAAGGAPRNAGAARAGAADFDYSSGQRPAAPTAAGSEQPGTPNTDALRRQRDQERADLRARYADTVDGARERAAAAAPNNGAPQANPNRLRNEPSPLRVRQVARNLPGGQNVPFTVDGFRYIRTADGRITRQTGTGQAPAAQTGVASESKKMNKKTITEASVNINGTADEIAELMRMMQLAGAPGAKPVDATDINAGPKPCPVCGKIHGPMPKPGGCGSAPAQGPAEPDMGDMIRMMSVDEEQADGGFGDATTEPSDTYMASNAGDVSDVIPDGNDLHKEKDAYPAVNGGDNAMRIKEQLYKALAEKKAKPDFLDVDNDGNKKEPMKKALKDKKKKK